MKFHFAKAFLVSILIACNSGILFAQNQNLQDIDALVEQTRADFTKRGLTLTADQEAKMRLQHRQALMQIQMFQGAFGGQGSPVLRPQMPAVAADQPPAFTTEALATRVGQLPAPEPVQVQSRRDGFELNGVRVIDPEGKISRYSVNPSTGDYTYLVERNDGRRLVKRGRGAQEPSFPIAAVSGRTGTWSVRAVDGQTSQGDMYALSPQGLVVMREDAAFEFVPGKYIRSFALPRGWNPVPLQRGDISGTRYMLVEKSADARPAEGSVGSIFQSFKRLAGTEVADDYALLNLDTGKLVKLAIDMVGKNVTRMSECRKQNAVVNVCNRAESFESLWGTDGAPNTWHYYWRVVWMDTPEGPMAISNQQASSEIRVFDLRTGKEVVAFRRPLGIANWALTPGPSGTYGLAAQLAFTVHKVPDVRKLLDTAPDWTGKEVEGIVIAGVSENSAATLPGAAAAKPVIATVQATEAAPQN
jgi:hypothetical protein